MGGEFGQTSEWNIEKGLHWQLTEYKYHKGVQSFLRDLNHLYNNSTALYEQQFLQEGFEWIDLSDGNNSVLVYLRKGKKKNDFYLVVCNFTPVIRESYKIGVPTAGTYKQILNSDAAKYGGSDFGAMDITETVEEKHHGRENALEIILPPLATVIFKLEKPKRKTQSKTSRAGKPMVRKAGAKRKKAKA